jgi:hypothetical protein
MGVLEFTVLGAALVVLLGTLHVVLRTRLPVRPAPGVIWREVTRVEVEMACRWVDKPPRLMRPVMGVTRLPSRSIIVSHDALAGAIELDPAGRRPSPAELESASLAAALLARVRRDVLLVQFAA